MDHSLKDRIAGHGLAAVFVLLAVTLLIAERVPQILIFLAVLLAAPAAQWERLRGLDGWRLPATALGGLAFWMLLSSLWAIGGLESFERGIRVALTVLAAGTLPLLVLLLPRHVQAMATRGAWIAAAIVLVLLMFEAVTDVQLIRLFRYYAHGEIYTAFVPPPGEWNGIKYAGHVFVQNRLTYIAVGAAILALPLAAFFWQRRWFVPAGLAVAAALVGLELAPTTTPFTALALAVLLAPFGLLPGRRAGLGIAAATGAGVMVMLPAASALFAYQQAHGLAIDPSIVHRLAIWDYVAGIVSEDFLAGHGVEASRIIGRQGAELGEIVADWPFTFMALPLHPHNASVQIWLELGFVGAALFAAFLFGVVRAIWGGAGNAAARMGLAGGFFAALAIAHLSFGIWQFWWLATLGLTAAMAVLLVRGETAP